MEDKSMPMASVIIPVLNGEKYIRKCLEQITKQDYPTDRLEVIIVDNGSTDATISIIKEYDVRLVHCSPKGAGVARNTGVEESSGDILIFIDADCLADRSLVSAHVRKHLFFKTEDPSVRAIGGSIAGVITNFWSMCDDFCCWFQQHPKLSSRYIYSHWHWPTANLSISRETFYKIGKFNSYLLQAEDVEFCQRITGNKYQLYFESLAKVRHINRTSYKDVLKRINSWSKIDDNHFKYGIIKRTNSILLFAAMNFFYTTFKPVYYSFLVKRFHVLFFFPFLIQNAFLFAYRYMLAQYKQETQQKYKDKRLRTPNYHKKIHSKGDNKHS